jgi:hypothetical protein
MYRDFECLTAFRAATWRSFWQQHKSEKVEVKRDLQLRAMKIIKEWFPKIERATAESDAKRARFQ